MLRQVALSIVLGVSLLAINVGSGAQTTGPSRPAAASPVAAGVREGDTGIPVVAPGRQSSPSTAPSPVSGGPLAADFDTAHVVHSINIGVYGCGDPFIGDPVLQQVVAVHAIPYIRAPFRDGCSDAQYTAMIAAIVKVGAVPQVTIHGNCTLDTRYQSVSNHFLSLIDAATGTKVYWVEYGNEEDAGCNPSITSAQYVGGWNRDVPGLHANHPRARFIGPVTAGHNEGWINALLTGGVPHPDGISWHWYPCGLDTSTANCLTHTGGVINDVAQTDADETKAGVPAPIWITEWDLGFNQDQTTWLNGCFTTPSCVKGWLDLAITNLSHAHDTANLAVAEFYVLTNLVPTSYTQLCFAPPTPAPPSWSWPFTYVGAEFFGALPQRAVNPEGSPAPPPSRQPVNQVTSAPTPSAR